eukprot:3723280-Prorocentrum_lima.AAC.1
MMRIRVGEGNGKEREENGRKGDDIEDSQRRGGGKENKTDVCGGTRERREKERDKRVLEVMVCVLRVVYVGVLEVMVVFGGCGCVGLVGGRICR